MKKKKAIGRSPGAEMSEVARLLGATEPSPLIPFESGRTTRPRMVANLVKTGDENRPSLGFPGGSMEAVG